MAPEPFRFIQASDFLLHEPPHGLAETPEHLIELLVEAPYRAATRVFDLALAEHVDFVLLAGNLVDPHLAGPRGLDFLHAQLARLAERHIPVYWATSSVDGQHEWPLEIQWPANVRVFPAHRAEAVEHRRDGHTLCRIGGYSVDSHHDTASSSLTAELAHVLSPPHEHLTATELHHAPFSIAVVPHGFDAHIVADLPVNYWALGGHMAGSTRLHASFPTRVVHFAGSPQGRCGTHVSPHGCTLVHVDERGAARLVPMPSDAIRWHDARVTATPEMQRDDLELAMHDQMQAIIASAADRAHLVRWTIDGAGRLVRRANAESLAADLTSALRKDYGHRQHPAWTTAIHIQSPPAPEHWLTQETLLGEFLRAARQHDDPAATPLDLTPYIPERLRNSPLAERLVCHDPAIRAAVLREAAALGSALLHPDDDLAAGVEHQPSAGHRHASAKEAQP